MKKNPIQCQCTLDSQIAFEEYAANRKLYDEAGYRKELIEIIERSLHQREVGDVVHMAKTVLGRFEPLESYSTEELETLKGVLLAFPLKSESQDTYGQNQLTLSTNFIRDRFGNEWYLIDDTTTSPTVLPVKNGKVMETAEPVTLHPSALVRY